MQNERTPEYILVPDEQRMNASDRQISRAEYLQSAQLIPGRLEWHKAHADALVYGNKKSKLNADYSPPKNRVEKEKMNRIAEGEILNFTVAETEYFTIFPELTIWGKITNFVKKVLKYEDNN